MNYSRPAGLRNALPVLTLLVLCLSQTQAQTPPTPSLTGKVAHITILGTKNISPDTVRAVLSLKVGDAYTPEAVAKDVAAIKDMGVFNAASAAETSDPAGGVDVDYTVAENPVVQSIKFTANTPSGLPTIPAPDLLAQMTIKIGDVLNTNILVSDLNNLFNYGSANPGYASKQGYGMDVSADINIDPRTGVLTIPLVEYYIKSIEISGNSHIKTSDILGQMHTKPSDLYNANTLQNDLVTIYETGEFKQIGPFRVNKDGAGKVSITIPVVEQPAATGSLDEKQGKVIPFLYEPPAIAYPVVQVSVNGRPPLPFIVDTGTTAPLLLAPWAVRELGLSPSSKVEKANNFSFSRVSIKSAVLQGLSHSNDASVDTQEAFMTDWDVLNLAIPRPHIAGIIGLAALASATSRFDFAAKTLTIFTAPHPPLLVPGGITLPLRRTSTNVFTVHAVLAPETSADLVLDTGSNGTQVPLSALPALHSVAAFGSNFTETVDGTVYLCPSVRLPGLMLGKAQVLNTPIATLPSTVPQSLGMNILAGYRMTLDGPNAQLTLEPAAHSGRYEVGDAALFLKQSGAGWAIEKFEKGSPAQKAGLKAEDKILTVNGADVTGVQEIFCESLLDGLLAHRVQVTVERGTSKLVSISWIATLDFDVPPSPIDGLAMQKPLKGSWMILMVIKGCLGDKAGLLAGDSLTNIDGEATATMSLDRFPELVKEPSVLLEVERVGMAQPFTVTLSVPK